MSDLSQRYDDAEYEFTILCQEFGAVCRSLAFAEDARDDEDNSSTTRLVAAREAEDWAAKRDALSARMDAASFALEALSDAIDEQNALDFRAAEEAKADELTSHRARREAAEARAQAARVFATEADEGMAVFYLEGLAHVEGTITGRLDMDAVPLANILHDVEQLRAVLQGLQRHGVTHLGRLAGN